MASEIDPKDFREDAFGQADRWRAEFDAAKERLSEWKKQAEECVARYLDERDGTSSNERRLNLYTSGIQTRLAMLYGKTPDVKVERRFADANDDQARVAAEMLERVLNADLERTGDNFQTAQCLAGLDFEVPGLGVNRLRYVAEFEPVEQPVDENGQPVQAEPVEGEEAPAERKTWEDVETDWVHWDDVLYNAARVFHEVRWIAFRSEMSREARDERFAHLGKDVLAAIPTKSTKPKDGNDAKTADPLASTHVWEIWSKRDKKVYWYVEGFDRVLDVKDDPLGLDGFFPCPEFMVANPSTSKLVPRPDWVLYQDQYREIDQLTTRIGLLRDAIRVAGVYDKASAEVKNLLERTGQNRLYPVDNWAMFAEKGGIRGAFELLPLADIVGALSALRENRAELIQDLYQVTGMSDIMRGQASTGGVTATEQSIKARFGSVRMQARQDRAAKFASDTQRIRAEIICKHFDPETIVARSNMERSFDADRLQEAVQLLKSRFSDLRISIKPDSMSMSDFAALKQERMEVLTAISGYMSIAAGIVQQMPQSLPGLLKILQHTIAGLRGADGLESVIDQMVTHAEMAAQQPQPAAPPDPKVQAAQFKLMADQQKGQLDMKKEEFKLQADLVRGEAEVRNDAMREENQRVSNVREAFQKQQMSIANRALHPQPKPNGGIP